MNSAVVGNLKVLLSMDTTNFDKGATSSAANVQRLADRLSKDLIPSQTKINSLIRDFAGSQDISRALAMAKAVEQVGGAAKLTAAEQTRVNRTVQEAIDKYRALGQSAPKHLQDLATATRQAHRASTDLGDGMSTLISKGRMMAGLFGVSIGAGALAGFVSQTFQAADQIGDLALKMGVSVEAAQRFQPRSKTSRALSSS
jgi:hypothetical protein